MSRGTLVGAAVMAVFATLLVAPFLSGERALFPFHTGSLEPFSTTSPAWSRKDASPANFVVGDKHTIIHPDLTLTLDAWRSGRLPKWNPYNFAGLPHQANPLTATFYPPNLCFLIGDPVGMYAFVNALHLLLAALFTWRYLKAVGLAEGPAILGGLTFALSGWMAVHVHHNYFVHAFTWLPLGLTAIERGLAGKSRLAPAALAISVAMSFLAGFPQTAVINCWILALYAVVALGSGFRDRGALATGRAAAVLAAFATLGLALAAVQLVPTLEWLAEAGHQDIALEHLRADALRPGALWNLVSPELLGDPFHDSNIGDKFFALWWLTDPEHPFGHLTNNFSERTFFAGTATILLALTVVSLRRDRVVLTWLVLGAIGVSLALATPLLDFCHRLPGFDFGSPMRYTQVAAFAMPVLFACAVDRLTAAAGTRRPRLSRLAGAAAVLVVVPLFVLLLALWSAPTWTLKQFIAWMQAGDLATRLGAGAMSAQELFNGLEEPFYRQRGVIGVIFTAVAAFVGWLGWLGSGRLGRQAACLLVGLLVVTELGWYGARFNRPVRREMLYETPHPAVEFLQRNLGDARFVRYDGGHSAPLFLPNAAQVWKVRDAQGFRALAPRTFLDFMRTVEPNPVDVGFPNLSRPDSLLEPQLGLLRVKYAISPVPAVGLAWPQVFPTATQPDSVGMWIYENPAVLPRAFFADEVRVRSTAESLAEIGATTLSSADATLHPLRRTVWLEGPVGSDVPTVDRSAWHTDVSSDWPESVVVKVPAEAEGVLVLAEQYAPGWTVRTRRLDGSEAEASAWRADHAFLGTRVEPGTASITFRYAPRSSVLGRFVSGIAAVVILSAAFVLRRTVPVARSG